MIFQLVHLSSFIFALGRVVDKARLSVSRGELAKTRIPSELCTHSYTFRLSKELHTRAAFHWCYNIRQRPARGVAGLFFRFFAAIQFLMGLLVSKTQCEAS
jgi:hypothetical protein